MAQGAARRDKERQEEWEAVVNALLTHADNALERLHEAYEVWASATNKCDQDWGSEETEIERLALLRCGRTLATFMENSGRKLLEC